MSRRLPRHVRKDDLESAAMLGLAQAARSFDPDRGIAFERHASNRIRGALLDELRGADWASRSVRSKARRMQRTADELAVELGHEPTRVQLAAQLGVDTQALERLEENVHRATVLNYDSIVEQGEELLPTGEAPPEAVLLDRERRARTGGWPAARPPTTPLSPLMPTPAPGSPLFPGTTLHRLPPARIHAA